MIISRTPYRISFFGGGSDYPEWYLNHGGEVISSSINKYIYISCRNLPSFFGYKYRIIYSKIENVQKIKDIKHSAVKEALNLFKSKIKLNTGLEIHYNGDLPSKSGMGSSSAFTVGLLNALNNYITKKNFNKEKLTYQSIFLEQKILKEFVGSQDQTIASYGGFNSIKFFPNGSIQVNPILNNLNILRDFSSKLFLVFTGINRTADHIARTYIKKLNKKKSNDIFEILQHVHLAKILIQNKNFDEIGLLLNETWKIKKSLSPFIATSKIDMIYNFAISNGATGGKLLGAGGGGFFLFYVKKENQNYFINKMKNFILIPFEFENKGSSIIFNDKINHLTS
jgi:D-glycero-alpha-D-manno-heptose-7-phosphate kinase